MSKTFKILLAVLIAVAVIMGIASSIATYTANEDIAGKIFAPSKYYEQYMIGADRANKEQMDIRFYVSEELIISRYTDDDVNFDVNFQSKLAQTDYNDLQELVMDKLPSFYRQLKIKAVYTGTLLADLTPNKDIEMIIKFSNGAIIYAWLPCNGDYYVHEVCKLKTVKRDATAQDLPDGLKISGTKGSTDCENTEIDIIEADYISDNPYIKVFWQNNTGKTLTYGSEYRVYRIDGIKTQLKPTIDNLVWDSLLHILEKGYTTRDFSLKYYDLSQPGLYCIEFNFEFDGDSTEYTAVLEFEIADTPENYSEEQKTSELPEEDTGTSSLPNETTTKAITVYTFNAKVLEVNKNSILVKPDKNTGEAASADKIYINTKDLKLPELNKNDEITVTYDGIIQETYPAKIANAYSVAIAE